MATSRELQSTRWWVSLFRVSVLFQCDSRGEENRARSMDSEIFVDIFLIGQCSVFLWS